MRRFAHSFVSSGSDSITWHASPSAGDAVVLFAVKTSRNGSQGVRQGRILDAWAGLMQTGVNVNYMTYCRLK